MVTLTKAYPLGFMFSNSAKSAKPEKVRRMITSIKSFCTTKETISKVKRQPSEWEKIIANEAIDKEQQRQKQLTKNLKNIQATPTVQFQKNK